MREHRRCLAEPHVERKAATQADRLEEAEPCQRFGLIAAQLADEAPRCAHRCDRFGGGQQVRRPPSTLDRDAPGERGLVEPKCEPQHLRPRELLAVVFRECFGRGLQVDLVERDPAIAGAHERL